MARTSAAACMDTVAATASAIARGARMMVLAALLPAALIPGAARAEDVAPFELQGVWLPLDNGSAVPRKDWNTCVGKNRGVSIMVMHAEGAFDWRHGGTATGCDFGSFEKIGINRWRSNGQCGHHRTTYVTDVWLVSRDGSHLQVFARYVDGSGRWVEHYRRCTKAETIANIGFPGEAVWPDALAQRSFALSYAEASSKVCPQYAFDEARAAAVARETEAFTADQIDDVRTGDTRPIPEIVRESLKSPPEGPAPSEDASEIGDHALYCAELFKRFGDNGTLIRGLLRKKDAPAAH